MAMTRIDQLRDHSVTEQQQLKNMKAEVEADKVRRQHHELQERRTNAESMVISDDDNPLEVPVSTQNQAYHTGLTKKLPFINSDLSQIIPIVPQTLYLIGAPTGGGKSTTIANIIIPILAINKKVLVVSNEEATSDVYTRVACRLLDYSYSRYKRGELNANVRRIIDARCDELQSVMTVIGDDFKGNPNFVCTPEGIAKVLEKFGPQHDAILIDYYQNVATSTQDMRPEVHWHQERFARFLNHFKNKFMGPIFLMSQMLPYKVNNQGNAHSFKERIEGRKVIANYSLVHIELIPDHDNYSTIFMIHKDRHFQHQGIRVLQGFDRDGSKFVPYTPEFQQRSAQWIAEKLQASNNASAGTVSAAEVLTPITQTTEEAENVDTTFEDLF
jgi:hypothetical protein